VSTTTRRARPSNFSDRLHHVTLHLFFRHITPRGDRIASTEERVESLLPLVVCDLSHSVRGKPRADGFPYQLRDWLSATLAEKSQRRELFFVEVDIRPPHAYIIHRP
jgi:hypothetical protein